MMMSQSGWRDAVTEGIVSGAIAGVLSAAVVAIAGRRDSGSAIAPINSVSHWLWGDEAARSESINVRHTGVGALTHVLSAMFWGTLHAKLRPQVPRDSIVPAAVAGGIATSAVAAVVDYGLIPKRLTPGWEKRVSTPSMAAAFIAIAAGIAAGTILSNRD
jgi:hypothetical protein